MKPSFPSGDGATDEPKAIWSKECDVHLKDKTACEENKGESFIIVFGGCTEAMRN